MLSCVASRRAFLKAAGGSATAAIAAPLFKPSGAFALDIADLNLALLMDVSGSIVSPSYSAYTPGITTEGIDEFRLQLEGTAMALESPDIVSAIEARNGVNLTYIQFGETAAQVLPWTHIRNANQIRQFTAAMRSAGRIDLGGGYTSIASGLEEASIVLGTHPKPTGT